MQKNVLDWFKLESMEIKCWKLLQKCQVRKLGLHGRTLSTCRPKWILFSETRPEPEGKETEEIPKETDQIQTMDDYIMAYCPDGFED